ncbi:MAG: hypothetical protein R3261_07310 [Alphaproteobacteria bacterium]|nr:hypothetical protein [Alphaproteobacteria bacterium]
MSTFYYHKQKLYWDLSKALFGLFLVGGVLIFANPVPWLFYTLVAITSIFILFLLKIIARFKTEINIDETGIEISMLKATRLNWADLDHFKLRYYSTKKSGDKGWMDLQLKGKGKRINVDSQLDGFEEVLGEAARHAAKTGLGLDPVTIDNLNASGINTPIERSTL